MLSITGRRMNTEHWLTFHATLGKLPVGGLYSMMSDGKVTECVDIFSTAYHRCKVTNQSSRQCFNKNAIRIKT